MEKTELIKKINAILAEEFEVEEDTITSDGDIKKTLDLDSLSLVDMVSLIETTFKLKMPSTELTKIKTFQNLYDYVFEKLK